MMYAFAEIEAEYSRLDRIFSGSEKSPKFPYGFNRDDNGGLHLELKLDGVMALVGTERGKETLRLETSSLEELMYWVFRNKAKSKAQSHELKNRHPTNDSRRIWFALSIKLLNSVSEQWATRLENEYEEILQKHPYRDRT